MNFEALLQSITGLHQHFQQQAAKAINVQLTLRNWMVGFYIVEFEQHGEDRAIYGNSTINTLAERLQHYKGMDRRALYRYKEFYLVYPQVGSLFQKEGAIALPSGLQIPTKVGSLIPQFEHNVKVGSLTPKFEESDYQISAKQLIEKLSFTHIEQLLAIVEPQKRAFYEIECIKGTWSVRELKRQIGSLYYERSGMSQKPEQLSAITKQGAESSRVRDLIKSVYTFEFLGLNPKDAVEESDLETALLDHLQSFILEMGHGFCLEARQKKILIGDEYFFVDLVFYHRILKCHVLVELKVEAFNHHNIGQLNTYLNYYKAEVQQPDDNPPVGILLVTDKNKALVEYATAGIDNQLFVSKYLLALPGKEVLEAFIQNELQQLK